MARILVIDDSPVIRSLLKEFLTDEGHETVLTADAVEGTRMALAEEWTLVICDTHMPEKNGYEVFADVTAQKPHLPFLITDSLPDDMTIIYDQVGGNYKYLKKPFELDQLRQVLKSCLEPTRTK
jgi:DNA-binding NtrC family response regulator